MSIGLNSVIFVFSVFCGLMVIIGVAAGIYSKVRTRHVNDFDDFVLGGRKLGVVAGFFTTTATMFSAYTYFAVTGVFYTDGVGAWYLGPASVMLCSVLMYIIGIPLWTLGKKHGFVNITEYLSLRFNTSVGMLSTIIMVIILLGYFTAQLRGIGLILNSLSGGTIPLWVGAVLLGLITALYVSIGGFRGVIWTDVLQGIMMYGVLIAATIFLVYKLSGGFSPLMSTTVSSENSALLSLPGPNGKYTFTLLFSSFFMLNVANYMLPHMQQRYLAYRSLKTLKINALALPVGLIIITICSFYIGIVGKVAFPSIDDAENIYPTMVVQLFPRFFGLIAIFAILGAVGSTASGLILTLSSIVSREWVNPLLVRFGHDPSQNRVETWSARIALPFVVAGGLAIAFGGPQTIVGLLVTVVFAGVSVLFPAVVGGLFWRNCTSRGAFWSIISGTILVILFSQDVIHASDWDGGFIAMLVATVVLIVVSTLTQRRSSPLAADTIREDELVWSFVSKQKANESVDQPESNR